ncbi:MAG: type I restriction enzyme, S subunit [Candidatus Methanocomedens sp.]|nr:MAG: type I restriction enzyme, S subunit [ANME-2 cluster archaeon]
MCEWKECKLGEICSLITDGKHGNCKDEENSGYYFISAKDVFNGKLHYENARQITRLDFEETDRRTNLQAGDLLITNSGTIGRTALALDIPKTRRTTFQKSVAILKPIDDYLQSRFFYYAILGNYTGLVELAEGTTQQNLLLGELRKFPIKIPPLPEQRAIASVLSSLDDKIDLLHCQNKTLEAMAEALFRQWFVEGAEVGWVSARVGDFVHTNVASINKDNALKKIRYLDTASLTEGKIDGYQTLDIADAPSRARRIVKHNDVLISTVRPNQKHYGILKNPAEDVIVSTGFCVITCDKIDPHFIYILLTTDEMTEYLHSIAEGSTSTYPSLKPSDIEGLEFQLPPQEKLDAYSEYADNAWSKIEYNHTQIRTLEKLRDTLLPKLMSGEVKVENENN